MLDCLFLLGLSLLAAAVGLRLSEAPRYPVRAGERIPWPWRSRSAWGCSHSPHSVLVKSGS